MTTSPRAAARAARGRIGLDARLDRLSDGRFAAVLAAPGLFLIGLFVVPPVLAVLALSLFRVELGFDSYRPFIALRNYAIRLGTDAFLDSLPLTIGFAVVVTAIAVPGRACGRHADPRPVPPRRRHPGAASCCCHGPWHRSRTASSGG